jgi:threonylcarbamoyladenosine tRNA methylthiotransferase MtaB
MITFSIQNFGCRVTDADANSLRHQLLARGLTLVAEHERADVVVLNTCTVTASADAQARDTVRKLHRANPQARIVVTGCYAQRAPEDLASLPGVTLVAGNSHLTEIPDAILARPDVVASSIEHPSDFIPLSRIEEPMSLEHGPAKILTGDIFAHLTFSPTSAEILNPDRTRPILKIQDGCNNRCSYCVIPFVRGRSRSLPPCDVIEEIRRIVTSGAKEVVLSGINLGSYGRDLTPRLHLAQLVEKILAQTKLERLRFSSIEPQDVTGDFIALVASSDRIAPHFHVPLESGSDRILKAMHRRYRAGHYGERIRLIRSMLPSAGIGADVIAGFPGETDADFQATAELIESLPLTYLHVFSFSARPGTEAAKLQSTVPGTTIRERARALRGLGQRKAVLFRASEGLRPQRALTLRRRGETWTECLTGNYLKVRVAGEIPPNQWVEVCVSRTHEEIVNDTRGQRSTPGRTDPNSLFAAL